MRLIDADKLSNNMIIVVEKANEDVIKSISELLGKIKNAPTIDAVQVVRCGECKYLAPGGICETFADDMIEPSASDYCSYGERRSDDADQ